MSFVTLILVYSVTWWLVFFAALPVGVRHDQETGETPVEGADAGAPSNPNLKKKALYTSIITLLITVIYYYVATSGLISFRG